MGLAHHTQFAHHPMQRFLAPIDPRLSTDHRPNLDNRSPLDAQNFAHHLQQQQQLHHQQVPVQNARLPVFLPKFSTLKILKFFNPKKLQQEQLRQAQIEHRRKQEIQNVSIIVQSFSRILGRRHIIKVKNLSNKT